MTPLTNTDTTTPAGVIAVDADLSTSAIYGIGKTGFEARDDARRGAGPDARFGYVPATALLIDAVEQNGGGPNDVEWTLIKGHVDHIGTDPAIVTPYALAGLVYPAAEVTR